MEKVTTKDFLSFLTKVVSARKVYADSYDTRHICQTLVNAASILQLDNSMNCSDRIDLMRDGEEDLQDAFKVGIRKLCKDKLGLDVVFNGDPRGAPIKLIVDASLGDSWGDRTHLCVPCVDAYQSLT